LGGYGYRFWTVQNGQEDTEELHDKNLWSFEMRGPVILKSDFVCEFKLMKMVLTAQKWLYFKNRKTKLGAS